MKTTKLILVVTTLIGLAVACHCRPCVADTAPSSVDVSNLPSPTSSFASQFTLTAALSGHPEGVTWPEIALTVNNNSNRWIGYGYTGPNDYHFVIDFLPDGQNPMQSAGWTRLSPRTPYSHPEPTGSHGIVFMNIAMELHPGNNKLFDIAPDDFGGLGSGLSTPGYYRISVMLLLEHAASYESAAYAGNGRPESLLLRSAPIIIRRTNAKFETWEPTATTKR